MGENVEKLRELLERVEKATGPDVEIDRSLTRWALCRSIGAARYTASIDAAVALVEKVLPGWHWSRDQIDRVFCIGPDGAGWWHEGEGETPPLAILSALLRALISQAEGRESR